jgi:hypothetical protein
MPSRKVEASGSEPIVALSAAAADLGAADRQPGRLLNRS